MGFTTNLQPIPKIEVVAYLVLWTTAVLFSMFQCYQATERYSKHFGRDLEEGWSFVGRKMDTADYEWNIWTPILIKWLRYAMPYVLLSRLLKKIFPKVVAISSIALSFIWLNSLLGLYLTLFVYIQPILFWFILKISSLAIVWTVCLSFTLGMHSSVFTDAKLVVFDSDTHQEYFFAVLLAWTHARSISYLIDTRDTPNITRSIAYCYYYCFYLPLLPSGPLLLYREFETSLKQTKNYRPWDVTTFLKSCLNVMRYMFWWGFNQLALHFFYHSALQYHPNLVRRLDIWSAGGFGYSLGQFFMLKYIVLYGVPSSLANVDDIKAPPAPKCVGRIHLYSQMWRDFDRGLYNFMLNYLYVPSKGSSKGFLRKMLASAVCFGFVCIWHGASASVIVWCLCNYFGVCVEAVCRRCSNLEPLATWKTKMTEANWIRFKAAAASPLLLMSALSNFCFFTDTTVSFILTRKVFEGGLQRFVFILAIMYCCCQVSMALERSQNTKQKLTKSIDKTTD